MLYNKDARRGISSTGKGARDMSAGRGNYNRPSIVRRFLGKFEMTDGCWIWKGSTSGATGYGRIANYKGKRATAVYLAHRFSFEFFNGPIPEGHCVCHKCDNPQCVNPAHLFAGTIGENNQDMHAKGRNNQQPQPGETNPAAKLSEADVARLRAVRAETGLSYPKLGRMFGIATSHAHRICTSQNWRAV